MKTTVYHTYLLACVAIMTLVACSKDIEAPSLPAPESTAVAQGVTLDPNQLFGIWEGKTEVGTDNTNHFVQQYRVEFQSIDDAEAIFSHWYVDAATSIRDSVCNMVYDYAFDGSTAELTPTASAKSRGAVKIKAVHTGGNQMVLYAVKANVTTAMCTLTRSGDPEPAVTAINRTLPQAGELVTLSGRNLQFVDHLYLPTADGEQEVPDFTATSRQISFRVPQGDFAPGHIRCQATGAHVSTYSPMVFCQPCVFFSTFSTDGTSAPYTGSEFENTINITQSLFDKVKVVSADNLPEGHCLTLDAAAGIVNPRHMLCFFGNAPVAWAVDGGLDPSTGSLRFSFGDRLRYVINHSGDIVTSGSKCAELAIEMDIYAVSNGQPQWNTGFMSFRLDKDQGKSLTQSWFAQTAMWSLDSPVSFADGWQTYTIPLSAFKVTENEAYATIGSLADYLVKNKKQTIVKLLNYQLDAQHPAQPLDTFQFCIANMRLVPYGIPANKRE